MLTMVYQCLQMITNVGLSQCEWLIKVVDRQEKEKDNLFRNNYKNISTSLFTVFVSTIYLVEIVMVRKKKWGEMWLASTVNELS
jgi:uncharacterized protein Yka (UPF0111/DUF47 family)